MLYTTRIFMQNHTIHMQKQADSVVSDTNSLLIPDFRSSTRGERHNSYYANRTMLNPQTHGASRDV